MLKLLDSPFIILSVIAQVYCIYHVLKHRKAWWWIPVILFFPPFGYIFYFFREVRGSGGSLIKRRMVNLNPEKQPASRRLVAELESQLEHSDTVATRLKLAETHLELGNYQESVDYFESCLRGYHKDDPVILFGLSRALFFSGHYNRCLEHLDALDKTGRTDYQNERMLLQARALASSGNTEEAEKGFEIVYNRLPGEEARCLYAQYLLETGKQEKAETLFREVLSNADRGDRDYRERNKEWIAIAKREL